MGLRKKKLFHRAASAFLAGALLITGIFSGFPAGKEDAEAADTAYLGIGDTIRYAGYMTHEMYADGELAYCVQPSAPAPKSGTYTKTYDLSGYVANPANEEYIRHVAYYCYGCPGFEEGKKYFPSKWYDGTAMTDERYLALSHIILSDVVSSSASQAMYGCTDDFKSWCRQNVIGYAEGGGSVINEDAPRVIFRKFEVPDYFQVYILNTGSSTQYILGWENDEPDPGGLTLIKRSLNTDITEKNSCYSLAGAVYYVYSDKNCTKHVGTLTTKKSGKSNTVRLDPGNYWIKEDTAPEGYIKDEETISVTLEEGQSETVWAADEPANDPLGITIEKADAQAGAAVQGAARLENAEFTIRYYDGQYTKRNLPDEATKTWVICTRYDAATKTYRAGLSNEYRVSGNEFYIYDGHVVLPIGTITIEETKAPAGYTIEGSTITANGVTVKDNLYLANITGDASEDKVSITVGNTFQSADQVIRGGVKIQKYDEDTKAAVPQGDASLAGAEYAIVSTNENPVVVGGKQYTKGQAVATITTGKDGIAQTASDALPFGEYYIEETNAPEGYNPNSQKVGFTISEDGKVVELTKGEVTDPVIKQAFSIIKISSAGENGETPVVGGAEFTVKLKSEVQKTGWDAAKSYAVLVTDSTGYAVSPLLPYGTYTVRETKTPPNMSTVADFEVTVKESGPTQAWRVFNDVPMRAYIKIVKEDASTGETVLLPGAAFRIRNTDTGEYVSQKVGNHRIDTFVTEEDGTVVTPQMLYAGNYELVEITAPDGYTLRESPIPFSISDNEAVEGELDADGDLIITVKASNEAVTGKVRIYKHGEILTGIADPDDTAKPDGEANTDDTAKPDGEAVSNTQFVYEDAPLEGTTFWIVADEDIYTPDHQADEDGNRMVAVYNDIPLVEGAVAATITSGEDGYAEAENLPLGRYHIEEVGVTEGYSLNGKIDEFELAYEGQEVSVVCRESDYENRRVDAELELVKTGSSTADPIQGAVYGLYAAEEILSASGEVLLDADSLIEEAVTDEEGKLSFASDVPLGLYYAKETKAPEGTLLNPQAYDLDLSYQGQDIGTIPISLEVSNDEISIEISKKDAETEENLEGAHLQIIDAAGNIYEEWVSAEEAHKVYRIPAGEYTLREDYTPLGYATAKDIRFTVKDTAEIQRVAMYDEATKVIVSKKDAETKKNLKGAHLQLLDADGKVYEEWDTTKKDHLITGIPVGTYTIHEEAAPDGYATAEDMEFEVKDTKKIQGVTMYDGQLRLKISKKDAETKEDLKGAHLQLLDADGKVYEEWDSDGEAHEITGIPAGEYILHEEAAPDGYATAEDIKVTVKDMAKTQAVTMYDKREKKRKYTGFPKTGDPGVGMFLLFSGTGGVLAAAGAVVKRKKLKKLPEKKG